MAGERVEINNIMKKYVTLKVAVTAAAIGWERRRGEGGIERNTW